VVGFDPEVEGFLWLAGQGGYGFQTAPAMASIAAALIAGRGIGPRFRDIGLTEEVLAPARFLRGRNRSDGRTLRAHDDDHGKTGNAE
jgi:glycine/D-amino acid oxidase-like deaminating enzyme